MDELASYKIFKGLQRPLEFMGLRGRYVWVGFGAGCATIIGFIVFFIAFGFVPALGVLIGIQVTTLLWIKKKSKRGLHTKHVDKGVFIVDNIIEYRGK